MNRRIIPGGLYRHYKNKWYFVIGEARHTETDEVFVSYLPLYGEDPVLYVRPKTMFLEAIDPVNTNGLQKWRFLESDATEIDLKEKVELLHQSQVILHKMGLAIVED